MMLRIQAVVPSGHGRFAASSNTVFDGGEESIASESVYLNPPLRAKVFCVDEKTAIQALDRLDLALPLSPVLSERRGFQYYRHGTLSLYAGLDTQSGKVLGKTAARHTSQEFVEFLTEVVERAPAREVHLILDNLWAYKSHVVRDFLAAYPNAHFHSTPTYSSRLNQVEIWFSKVERDMIVRGVFSSVKDLARKLRRYINAYSAKAMPIQWQYYDPARRIRGNVVSATCR